MTKELNAQIVAGLLEEKASYERRAAAAKGKEQADLEDRVAQVNAQLTAFGHKAKTPRKRAEKRPAPKAETRGKRLSEAEVKAAVESVASQKSLKASAEQDEDE